MNLADWLEFTNKILQTVSWPATALVLFFSLRKPIITFIGQINEAELPGGVKLKAIPKEIEKAEILKEKILNEPKKFLATKDSQGPVSPNETMERLRLEPSPSNLDMDFYRRLAEQNPNIALAGLRMDLEIMLRNLAKGFHVGFRSRYSITQLCEDLLEAGAITSNQFRLVKSIMNICNSAVHGQKITKAQTLEVLDMAPVLIDDYLAWLDWGFQDR